MSSIIVATTLPSQAEKPDLFPSWKTITVDYTAIMSLAKEDGGVQP